MTRIVILTVGGNSLSHWVNDDGEASAFVAAWAARAADRIRAGKWQELEAGLVTGKDAAGRLTMAVVPNLILGMYVVREGVSPVERIADVMERTAEDRLAGEEWRGDE